MKRRLVPFVCAAFGSWPVDLPADDTVLTLHAIEATAQIQRHDANSSQFRLPALELSLRATFACPGDTAAQSLTLSVSDTLRHYGADEIANIRSLDASVSVPADQFAPVMTPGFCHEGATPKERGLLLPGIATAQVSLRCGGESVASSVHFASVALPLRLHCAVDGDQDSSTVR